ncbi:MAG: ImmA/IrrE family metallo-endopeptidase [Clostridia bacterium]|nr:ImmA/IrrE family metallo-endopeptidase [Clostridia bacterium]
MENYFTDITARSRRLIRKYGTRDPFVIAEKLGIEILYADELKRLKGMYRGIKRNRFIILNSLNSPTMNAIVCAHELGHDQLHREYAKTTPFQEFMLYDMASRREYEANIFAADLMLDDNEVLDLIEKGYDTMKIAQATYTDINLVALKVDLLIRNGHYLHKQEHDNKFLK